MPLCSGLRSFCREVRWQPYGGSLEYDCFPLSAFRILFLSLTFTIWIICPDVHLFGFILFGALCVSCTSWISVSFFRFGNFSAIISSHSIPFSLCSSGVPIIPVLVCLMLFQRSLKLFVFFKLVFLFAVLFVGFPLFCLPDHLHILLYHLVCCSFLLVWFFFFYLSYWIIHSLLRLFTFLSSLLTFSLCTPILYPSSVNIFITNSLNYFSGKLLVSVSLFFQGFPPCFFNCEQFLCLFILFNFLCLYEHSWNSYLYWSWRGILMRECPCTDYMHLMPLVGELELMWMQVTFFLSVWWQLSPW